MQHNAYTHHGGTIGIGNNVNANDFPNSHVSNNNGHVGNAIQTSLPQSNNNSNNSNVVATAATISSRGIETGAVSLNDVTSIGGNTGITAVNYGSTFFGNDYHHQLTQSALMANTTTYAAAAASSAASTAMLTNYCDAAMMMAAAAVNANQCLQQQQQRMALMANCQTALTGGSSHNDGHDMANLNKNSSPINNDMNMNQNGNQRPHNINSSLVSAALSSASSTTSNTSSSSSLLSSNPSSATTSPSITLVNTASLISSNVVSNDMAVGHLQTTTQSHHHNHQLHLHHHIEPPVMSPNLIDISEVPLVVDVK